MIRSAVSTYLVLTLFAVSTRAEDRPRFAVTSEATRSGDTISVSLKIVENKMEVVPNIGNTNVTTTRSSPRIKFVDGRRAQIIVGRSRPADSGAPAATEPADIDSGIQVDVISIKGQDNVLIVTTVIEDGSTVWAEAATVKVQPKPMDSQKKADVESR
jgi:hypothetical protein